MKKIYTFFVLVLFLSTSAWADMSVQVLRKKFDLPSSEWVRAQSKDPQDILNLDHKKLGKALNISARTDNIPYDAKTYLTEVRKLLPEDKKNYGDAQINLVESKNLFGKDWEVVKIQAPDGLRQEMWCRKISKLQVVLFLYTGIGDPFVQYHPDFDKILEEGAKL